MLEKMLDKELKISASKMLSFLLEHNPPLHTLCHKLYWNT